ncbi:MULTISPECIES: hypothetical protein [Burkholderia]|uniref:hypothetical protein n=1 Tax=Burkholderia TaxID=32008 RepID=UPI00157B8149|nr:MULTISPECIES: hypothetical protein [Burkholderia]MCU9955767.1 hypothetical protein [Burkholderia sp. BKH01]NTY35191.1 hypothetical protein [Burkholderia diffusa]
MNTLRDGELKSAHTVYVCKLSVEHQYHWSSVMAKGQLRSNREAKKPKQPKKPPPVLSPSKSVQPSVRFSPAEGQKKR